MTGQIFYSGNATLSANSVPNDGLSTRPGSFIGSLTGVLEAGTYDFLLTYYAQSNVGSVVNAPMDWDLNLLTPFEDNGGGNGNGGHVPDTGSTMTLLGIAFSALGMARRLCL